MFGFFEGIGKGCGCVLGMVISLVVAFIIVDQVFWDGFVLAVIVELVF